MTDNLNIAPHRMEIAGGKPGQKEKILEAVRELIDGSIAVAYINTTVEDHLGLSVVPIEAWSDFSAQSGVLEHMLEEDEEAVRELRPVAVLRTDSWLMPAAIVASTIKDKETEEDRLRATLETKALVDAAQNYDIATLYLIGEAVTPYDKALTALVESRSFPLPYRPLNGGVARIARKITGETLTSTQRVQEYYRKRGGNV